MDKVDSRIRLFYVVLVDIIRVFNWTPLIDKYSKPPEPLSASLNQDSDSIYAAIKFIVIADLLNDVILPNSPFSI